MKTLREVKIGETCKVVRLHGEGAVKRRIMDIGITKGVDVFVRKVAPLGDEGRGLVTIGRDMQFSGDAFGQFAGQLGALGECDAANRDQRQHVGSPHARVCPLVTAHVDQLGGLFHPRESRFDDGFGRADERDDSPVGRLAGIHVQQLDAPGGFDGRCDLTDYCLVAPLAEIRDALHDTLFHR